MLMGPRRPQDTAGRSDRPPGDPDRLFGAVRAGTDACRPIRKAHSEGRLEDRLIHFGKPKPWIIDELGYLPFEPDAAHLFFQLVSRRYERGSMLITSNRAVGEWSTVFDAVVAATIPDRLLHHSHVITIRGTATGCARSGRPACCERRSSNRVRRPGLAHSGLSRASLRRTRWRLRRSARVPPTHYLDKPPRHRASGATNENRRRL
jgi:hypothetical protein